MIPLADIEPWEIVRLSEKEQLNLLWKIELAMPTKFIVLSSFERKLFLARKFKELHPEVSFSKAYYSVTYDIFTGTGCKIKEDYINIKRWIPNYSYTHLIKNLLCGMRYIDFLDD